MPNYIIRAEINFGEDQDYVQLHQELYRNQFYRVILASDNAWYDLPTATYYGASNSDTRSVQETVDSILDSIIAKKPRNNDGRLKNHESITSRTDVSNFTLKKTTDLSKLPPGARQN